MEPKDPIYSVSKRSQDQKQLIAWYQENRRDLPWRKSKDAYRIWISEIMLQQTTVTAVIPYFEKFIQRFPTVHVLAQAKEQDVLEYWAGLGYYSRARNLHKAAGHLTKFGFSKTAASLIKLPGFGPYTSRAVASLAFNEPVGVLDGNVIRVLSRRFGLKLKWWKANEKKALQNLADQLADLNENSDLNQGLMELGAMICTTQKPLCLMCPWKTRCIGWQTDQVTALPLKKPRVKAEIWHWVLRPSIKNKKIHLLPLRTTPFLKNLPFPEGTLKKVNKKPKKFHLKHTVTKYKLYLTLLDPEPKTLSKGQWVNLKDVKKWNPSSLLTKILNFSQNNGTISK